jgi:outer membrane protein assembly factor BamB
MHRLAVPILIILTLVLVSCSQSNRSGNPFAPPSQAGPSFGQNEPFSPGMTTPGRHVLGMWEWYFDFDAGTAVAVPLRMTEGHFNVRKFMENGPCTNCLTLLNFTKHPDQTFNVDVKLDHPFPGLDIYTGFDVRGTAIFNGSYLFPASGLRISDRDLGDVELLNADGYTTLFNPIDFPEGSGLPITKYSKGKRASVMTSPTTLNGYRDFYPDEPRRVFRAGNSNTQNYYIAWPTGTKLRCGYVVDANWEAPIHKPVMDPLVDFGLNANCREAYQVSVTIGSGLMPGCGFAPYQVDVWDHQGFSTISGVSFEAPELFTGIIANSSGVDMGTFSRFSGNLPNQLNVGAGSYFTLVCVQDKVPDQFMGKLTTYITTYADVEPKPIDYDSGWRKAGRTLDNNCNNVNETTLQPNLTEVWNHKFPDGVGAVFQGGPVVGDAGVYVVANVPYDQKIWMLSLETGEPVWNSFIKLTPDAAFYSCTPLVGNCEVYVGGSSLFALDIEDGSELWHYDKDTTQYLTGSPVVMGDTLIAGGNNNAITALNSFTGEFKWKYSANPGKSGNPSTPVVDNGVVYGADIYGSAFAINLSDGSEIWKIQFPNGGPINYNYVFTQPMLADGLIWIGCWNCHLYALDPANGSIVHDIPLGDQLPGGSPAYDGEHIYQATAYDSSYGGSFTAPYHVYAFNTDGTTAWDFPGTAKEAFYSTPAVANGVLWIASDAGKLYMIDTDTGNLTGQGTYTLDDKVDSAICIKDGRLYVIDESGKLYCLKTP